MTPDFLAYLLNQIGLTQRKLAAVVGQSATSVNAWVKNRAPVPPWLPLMLAMWMMLTDEQRKQAVKDADTLDKQ